jgi:hypothetical protein
MNGCRVQFWSIIGAIALLWTCGGIFYALATATTTGSTITATLTAGSRVSPSQSRDFTNSATGGAVIGGSLLFICTGLPVVLLSSLMAGGARRDIKEKRQLELQQQQTLAMQQMAAQNMALQPRGYPVSYQTPPDPRPQLEAAKALIQSGQYDAARNLLKTIDHPTAVEWIKKIDNKVKR